MYAEERQSLILERARKEGRVDVAQLSAEYGVTYETIRRDLTALERHAVLRRVHGGAIPVGRLAFEAPPGPRNEALAEEERIAKAALAELPENGAVLLGSGAVVAKLAEFFPNDRELTVVTNSTLAALSLLPRENIDLMMLGGRLRARTRATVDVWALRALEETYVDVAFITADGISAERGVTTADLADAQVKQAMIGSASRTVLLADHTKVGRDHFARVVGVEEIDRVITDSGLSFDLKEELTASGARVLTV
ncbi:DeoR/GlpR family DNA-binding transcription regulator [Nocardiopsis sp. LOL_012]|uniref:DeoR/GlpR family DNA-binding transcription regulator n=1 Tax=Nocardiopsis sp. LOL_012 TaxID=3345409 RepID=UPI003A8B15AE